MERKMAYAVFITAVIASGVAAVIGMEMGTNNAMQTTSDEVGNSFAIRCGPYNPLSYVSSCVAMSGASLENREFVCKKQEFGNNYICVTN